MNRYLQKGNKSTAKNLKKYVSNTSSRTPIPQILCRGLALFLQIPIHIWSRLSRPQCGPFWDTNCTYGHICLGHHVVLFLGRKLDTAHLSRPCQFTKPDDSLYRRLFKNDITTKFPNRIICLPDGKFNPGLQDHPSFKELYLHLDSRTPRYLFLYSCLSRFPPSPANSKY